ncbi:esterase/lipase family protein [Chengkuizengella sediminis]|uniref:esterase/lipase family protein n=1 Tax=Chengkuizengella sediminis TaxID=1885917 RepID=UPI00138946A7|nr:hypothetical protein [Chengkuizengella sediminis]NDI33240.1 hypothetical protein [Chengkuizengella sediminis]
MKYVVLFLVLLLIVSSVSFVYASGASLNSAPTPVNVEDVPGTWYLGGEPLEIDESKSPIVFVQGLHGNARDWWEETVYYGENDMYDYFYSNGYRTAFVQLEDATGEDAADMWDNGLLLAAMLEEIHDHFGEKVNIVSHSKGGVDTQAALIHYEAWPYVDDVITLSTPHYGTPTADLAYSWWANWLADLIGQTDDGTYSMQVGEMEKFRLLTDNHENALKNNYYTASGTGWGPIFSALWFGGAYLWEDSDGLVPVSSTQLPYGTHFLSGGDDVNHDNIRMGYISFESMDLILSNLTSFSPPSFSTGETNIESTYVPEQLLRGDTLPVNQSIEEVIPVESGNHQVTFQILTSGEHVEVTLSSPEGKQYTEISKQFKSYDENHIFKGSYNQTFVIDQPDSGDWTITMNSSQKDAFLIITNFEGSNALDLKWSQLEEKANQKPNKEKDKSKKEKKLKIDKKIKINKRKSNNNKNLNKDILNTINSESTNVTYEIVGTTEDGEVFYRTAVKSYSQ